MGMSTVRVIAHVGFELIQAAWTAKEQQDYARQEWTETGQQNCQSKVFFGPRLQPVINGAAAPRDLSNRVEISDRSSHHGDRRDMLRNRPEVRVCDSKRANGDKEDRQNGAAAGQDMKQQNRSRTNESR